MAPYYDYYPYRCLIMHFMSHDSMIHNHTIHVDLYYSPLVRIRYVSPVTDPFYNTFLLVSANHLS